MKILSKIEVDEIIAEGRLATEHDIMALLDDLEKNHPAVYQMIYGEPSQAIYGINQDMANLYLDLSCDVIWLFAKAFGKIPNINDEETWVLNKLSLIDAELKSLTNDIPMDSKIRDNLQERFVSRSFQAKIQLELMNYLDSQVNNYASFNTARDKAVQITNSLLFILVRLMGDLYSVTTENSEHSDIY